VSGAGVVVVAMEEAEVIFANANVNGIASVLGSALSRMCGLRYRP
jgi:hypothetical protein